MKKNILKILLAIVGVMVLATPVLAATTVSFSPASVSINPGQSFNFTINIDPQTVKNYTVKVELNFPADLLEIKSFTFGASGWMAWNQPGYDLTDNTNGVLIKTAGYPGGFSSAATFGTVTFYAKKAGSGVIKLGEGSLAFDANNQNVLSGTPSVSVAITPPPVSVPAEKPAAETPAAPEEQPTTQPVEQPIEQPTAQAAQPSLLAAILTLGTGNVWVGIIVGLVILAVIVYVVYLLRKKKRNDLGNMQ